MKNKLILFLLLGLATLFVQNCKAQAPVTDTSTRILMLRGEVYDSETKKPVPNVKIYFDSMVDEFQTDSLGVFNIKLKTSEPMNSMTEMYFVNPSLGYAPTKKMIYFNTNEYFQIPLTKR